jgi:hypothetical protein
MPAARDAKEWAASGGLHEIGRSSCTPCSGVDGETALERAGCAEELADASAHGKQPRVLNLATTSAVR